MGFVSFIPKKANKDQRPFGKALKDGIRKTWNIMIFVESFFLAILILDFLEIENLKNMQIFRGPSFQDSADFYRSQLLMKELDFSRCHILGEG